MASALDVFLAAQADGHREAPLRAAHDAFRRAGEALLGELPVACSERARAQVVDGFVARLAGATAPAFEAELDAARPVVDLSRDGWLERLERLPGLAEVVDLTCRNWREATHELFDRLARDLPLLAERLWFGGEPGRLVEFHGDTGDLHAGGRSVAILTFAEGYRVVYKPKDLRVAVAFMELVRFLNERGLPHALPTREVVCREGYAWEEYVAFRPCSERAGLGRYYVRFGMLLRLLELLEGRDFWLDNVLASGEMPVFVDLETLLQPRTSTCGAAERLLLETVAPTGAVTCPLLVAPGRRAEDCGGLAPWRERLMPHPPGLERLQAASGELRLDGGHLVWEPPPTCPVFAGEVADPRDYHDEVVAGYRAMAAALAAAGDDLPIASFADAPVRHIARSTWDCHAILRASVRPGVLRSLDGRARLLAQLPEHERAAFLELDVPLFLSLPRSSSAFTPDGTELENRFEGTAWERLERRVGELDRFPLERHAGVLDACLSISVEPPLRTARRAARDGLVGHAAAIGDAILGAAVEPGRWVGLVYDPRHDLVAVGPLGTDLLSGRSGLAILFAELAAATGEGRFRAAALDALPRDASGAVGVFAGAGSVVYALARCADRLGEPGLRRQARTLASTLDVTGASGDVILGKAGLALALQRLDLDAAHLLDDTPSAPFPPDAARLAALPGVELARARAGAAGPPARVELDLDALAPLDAIEAALAAGRVDDARAFAGGLVADFEETGRWLAGRCPDLLDLSIVHGLAAVALALLRAADPAVASVRLVA